MHARIQLLEGNIFGRFMVERLAREIARAAQAAGCQATQPIETAVLAAATPLPMGWVGGRPARHAWWYSDGTFISDTTGQEALLGEYERFARGGRGHAASGDIQTERLLPATTRGAAENQRS